LPGPSASSAAWPLALTGVDEQWLEPLHGTRNAWARAYRGAPVRPAERALDLVARDDAGELVDLDAPLRCPTCGNTFEPHPRAPVAIYCSRRCQKRAADRRDREHVAA
jgi:hypothetical protein